MQEPGTDRKRRQLRWSLQALAQPADVQLGLYPNFACKADELALEFRDAFLAVKEDAENLFGQEQAEALGRIEAHLKGFSGEANADHWTEEALCSDRLWAETRALAKDALRGAWAGRASHPPRTPA